VVDACGVTLRLPDAATVPMPWLIVTLAAFVVLHVSVAVWPLVIDAGDAPSVAVGTDGGGGGGGGGGGVSVGGYGSSAKPARHERNGRLLLPFVGQYDAALPMYGQR
jgi:hypothetical protein